MKETYIDIFGHSLYEPVTVITNLFITFSCIYFYFKLSAIGINTKLTKSWRLFFLFIGLSAFVGGVAHGFKPYFSDTVFFFVWMGMNVCSIVGSYYLLQATITISEFTEKTKRKLNLISLIYTGVLTVITITLNDFLYMKINAGIVILFAIIRHYQTHKKGYDGSGLIVFGFAFSLTSIIIHSAKLSLSDWFNFKDISHVIMNISLYIIFRGVLKKMRFIGLTATI